MARRSRGSSSIEKSNEKSDEAGDYVLPQHVVVAEDDAVLAMMIEDALHDAGIAEVEICASTKDAMRALSTRKPKLVIIDVHLADSDDGWAIAELVESMKPNAPRVIFSTGAPQDIPEQIAAMGPVLEKPYDAEELLAVVRQPRRTGLISRLRRVIR
ncbi:response regulator [Parapontixanthobacter aurantiacus]